MKVRSMNSSAAGSVTGWIGDLKMKDPEAQRKIWNRFVDRLVRYANRKLHGGNCQIVDASDIANMAFANFFEKSPEQFESLVNRNDLWQILALLAERRAIDEIRKAAALKNGGGRLLNESMLGTDQDGQSLRLDHFAEQGTTPDFDVLLNEELETRLNSLNDEVLRQIAIEKMQGCRNREIAAKLTISLRSVERKLGVIRDAFVSLPEP